MSELDEVEVLDSKSFIEEEQLDETSRIEFDEVKVLGDGGIVDFELEEDEFEGLVNEEPLKIKDVQIVDVNNFVLTPRDSKDPSYSNLVLPYRVVCRQRYRRAGAKQRAQFIKEIKQHELLQTKALDGVRIHREFCNAIISQPKPESLITLTDKQKMKLEELLAQP